MTDYLINVNSYISCIFSLKKNPIFWRERKTINDMPIIIL